MSNNSVLKIIWSAAYPLLTHIAIYFIVIFGAVLIFDTAGCESMSTANEVLNTYSAYITIISVVITIPILYLFYRKDYPLRSNIFFKRPKYIAGVIALAILAEHGLSILVSLSGIDSLAGSYSNVEQVVFSSDVLIVIIRTVILAPLCEELLFRGLVFRRIRKYTGFWVPAIISSLIFGLYHMNLSQGVFAFLFGIILCGLYDLFKNLWVPMIVHAAGNAASVIFYITGFAYSSVPVFIAVMAACLVLAFIIYYFLLRKASQEVEQTLG